MTFYTNSKIAAGNNNTGGYAAWEAIKPTGDTRYFLPPKIWGTYRRGDRVFDFATLDFFKGFPSCKPVFGFLTVIQFRYLMDTFCGGGYSGLITAKLHTETKDTYADFNAIMRLPMLTELDFRAPNRYRPVEIMYVKMVAL